MLTRIQKHVSLGVHAYHTHEARDLGSLWVRLGGIHARVIEERLHNLRVPLQAGPSNRVVVVNCRFTEDERRECGSTHQTYRRV